MPRTCRSDNHWLAQSPARCHATITSANRRSASSGSPSTARSHRVSVRANSSNHVLPTSRASASLCCSSSRPSTGWSSQPDAGGVGGLRLRRGVAAPLRRPRRPLGVRSTGVGTAGARLRQRPHVAGVRDPGLVAGRQRPVDQPVDRRRTALGLARKTQALASARSATPSVSVPNGRRAPGTARPARWRRRSPRARTGRRRRCPSAAGGQRLVVDASKRQGRLGPADQLVAESPEGVLARRHDDPECGADVAGRGRCPPPGGCRRRRRRTLEPRPLVGPCMPSAPRSQTPGDPRGVPAGSSSPPPPPARAVLAAGSRAAVRRARAGERLDHRLVDEGGQQRGDGVARTGPEGAHLLHRVEVERPGEGRQPAEEPLSVGSSRS